MCSRPRPAPWDNEIAKEGRLVSSGKDVVSIEPRMCAVD
jgi:hypothetical protein